MQSTNLPQASTDIDRLKADLDEFGYAVVANALSDVQTETIRARLVEQAFLERERGLETADHVYDVKPTAEQNKPNQWVYGLINKGDEFRISLDQPLVRALIAHVLGNEYILSDLTAHITHPGNADMSLHTDQWWMPPLMTPGDPNYVRVGDLSRDYSDTQGIPEPADHPILPPFQANVIWMLCDFTLENGATRFVPRSHLSGCQPDPEIDYESVRVTGVEGTAIVWDARIWHAAGANTSSAPRYALVTPCKGPQLRQRVNFPYATKAKVLDRLSAAEKKLLGFESWHGVGNTDDPRSTVMRPAEATLGPLYENAPSTLEAFWHQACMATGIDTQASHSPRRFGDPKLAGEDVVDGLVAAVKQGKKRGTAPPLLSLQQGNLPIPEPGEYWVVVDSREQPTCVVVVEKVEHRRFDEVDAEWAAREGEADGSFEYWHWMHRWYYGTVYRHWNEPWSDDIPVVLIYFDLVYSQ